MSLIEISGHKKIKTRKKIHLIGRSPAVFTIKTRISLDIRAIIFCSLQIIFLLFASFHQLTLSSSKKFPFVYSDIPDTGVHDVLERIYTEFCKY